MKVELKTHTADPEKHIEFCGRFCYDSNDKANETTTGPFIAMLIANGHLTPLEHASATFVIEGISRACANQLVRHRIASYCQKSDRYTKPSFDPVIPPSIEANPVTKNQFNSLMKEIQWRYEQMTRDQGIKKEDARFILPQGSKTNIVVTMNFHALRNFFKLRLSKKAQWEIREMAYKMLRLILDVAPNVFQDFTVDMDCPLRPENKHKMEMIMECHG